MLANDDQLCFWYLRKYIRGTICFIFRVFNLGSLETNEDQFVPLMPV